MRIVYVIEKLSGKGGLERITIDKMNYLAEHTAYEIVLLLIWHDDRPLAYTLSPKVRVVRLNVPFVPKFIIPKLLALYRYYKEIKRLMPDITVYTWTMGAFLAAFTSWKGKSIYESHQPLCTMHNRWLIRKAAKNVDIVTTLTIGDAYGYKNANKVITIPNFTSLPVNQNTDYSKKTVVFVGRNSPEKDIPRLNRIWGQVQQTHMDWQLIIHHQVEDVVKAYLGGSIFVLTSKMEGFGLVLVEAMTCGLPCVAFDSPYGPRDIIEDGKTGYLIPYNDDQMFIDKLSALMDDEALRRKMGKAAKVSSQRYQPAPIMAQWLKLFSDLIK